jgi:hypothetical protein
MSMQLAREKPSPILAISIEMGIWMLVGFISFFLLMYSMGFAYRTQYCIFNMVIQMFFIFLAIRKYYLKQPEFINNYVMGLVQGMGASVIGITGYTLFMTIFLWMNPVFFNTVRKNTAFGDQLSPFMASLLILVLGVAVGLIWSYIVTRFLGYMSKKENRYVESGS